MFSSPGLVYTRVGNAALLRSHFSMPPSPSAKEFARQKLRYRRRKIDHLLDLSFDAILVRDEKDRIEYWNQGATELYGYTLDEALGCVSHELLKTEFCVPLDEIRRVLRERGRWSGEIVHTRKDGTKVVVSSRWSLDRDQNVKPTRILETNQDVTDRRSVQDSLALAEQTANIGTWDWTVLSREIKWSKGSYALYEYPEGQAITYEMWCDRIDPEDLPLVKGEIRSAFHSGRGYDIEFRLRLPSGTMRWVNARGEVTEFRDGAPFRMSGINFDVTARKRNEEAVAIQNEQIRILSDRLRLALDAAQLGWWHYDPIARVASFDERFVTMYQLSADILPIEEMLAHLHPQDVAMVRAKMEAALNPMNPVPYHAQYRIILADNTVRWIEAYGIARFEDEGSFRRATSLVGTVADITENKLADEVLAAGNERIKRVSERLRLALDAASLGWWHCDLRTNIASWDDRFKEIFAVPTYESSIAEVLARVHPEDVHRLWESFETAMDLAHPMPYSVEYRLNLPDATLRWVEAHGIAHFEEQNEGRRATYLVGTVEDITDAKLAREALRESQEQLSLVLHASDLGTWDWNLSTGQLELSPRCLAMFGMSAKTQVAYQDILQSLHPEDRERTDRAVQAAIQEGADYRVEMRTIWSDGSVHWVYSRGRAYHDKHGKPLRMSGTVVDITERRRTEENLRKAERLASAGRMAGVVAHEINNPLDTVVNCLSLLANSNLGATEREYLDIATEELNRVVRITRHTLGSYRIGGTPQVFNCSRLAEEVIATFLTAASSRRIELQSRVQPGQKIEGFAGEIRQVLTNLVINAMDAGGSAVRVRVVESFDRKQPEKRGVRISVLDNGRGIAKADAPNIFAPFFTTKGEKGTGLGLWVCKGIVQKHEGSITFRTSSSGSGSVFSVFLPSSASQPTRADAHLPAGAISP